MKSDIMLGLVVAGFIILFGMVLNRVAGFTAEV